MMTTSEKATQKSMTLSRRSVHHTNFLWALCQELVLSTTQRFVAANGAGLPFSEITPSKRWSLSSSHESRSRGPGACSSARVALRVPPKCPGFHLKAGSHGDWLELLQLLAGCP